MHASTLGRFPIHGRVRKRPSPGVAHTMLGKGVMKNPTLELMGSSFRPRTVPHIPRSLKASRRVRTTLMQYGTLEEKGVPMLQATPSVDWDSLHVVLTMQRQGGDASRVAPCPVPLSHRSASPMLSPRTPCTLGRLDAFITRGGGVSGGCETSIPQPLKYMHHLFVPVSSCCEVLYASN